MTILVTAIGNAGRDPEQRGGERGPVVFSIACSSKDRGTNDTRTDWFDVVCFGIHRERALRDVSKGARVVAVGRQETKTAPNGKEYRAIIVEHVEATRSDRRRDDGGEDGRWSGPMKGHERPEPEVTRRPSAQQQDAYGEKGAEDDEDIPF